MREGAVVKHNLKYKGTVTKIENDLYTSSDSLNFIGRTKEYIFIYRKKDESMIVIPASSIIYQSVLTE